MYNDARILGAVVGAIVALVIVIIIRKFILNKEMTTQYDEMQKQIRGEAYKYAFFAMIIFEALVVILTLGVEIPAEPYVIHFFAMVVGITVQASYSIWKGAYVGLNMNLKRYVILITIIALFNLFTAFMDWRDGDLITDGKFQAPTINLLCGLMFAVIGVVGLVKRLTDREE